MEPGEFAAIVARVLASMPAIRIARSDVDAAAADLVRRVLTAYPRPRRRPLFGLRAIFDAEGADSWIGMRAQRAGMAFETAIVASRLARLRSDGHAPQAEALLRLLEGRNVEDESPVIASRHGRRMAPVFGVRAVAEASGLDPHGMLSMVMAGHARGIASRVVCSQLAEVT